MTGDHDTPVPVRVPSIEVADKILFGLTAKQLAYAAATIAAVFTAWQALSPVTGPAPAGVVCVVLGLVGAALVFVRRDQTGLDRLLLAALRHPHRPLVPATTAAGAPDWVLSTPVPRRPQILRTPIRDVTADGTIDLGSAGFVAVLEVTGLVNFALLAPGDQRALTTRLAQALHTLTGPIQILTVTATADTGDVVDALTGTAGGLPPRIADAAEAHAAYLRNLTARHRPTQRHAFAAVPAATRSMLDRRVTDTADALAGCGLNTTRLGGVDVADLLTAITDPHQFEPSPEDPS